MKEAVGAFYITQIGLSSVFCWCGGYLTHYAEYAISLVSPFLFSLLYQLKFDIFASTAVVWVGESKMHVATKRECHESLCFFFGINRKN